MSSTLRVLDAARQIIDEIQRLIDTSKPRLIHVTQLSRAMGSITWNIREAYGHVPGPGRNLFFRHALASAEETDEQLRANYAARRVDRSTYLRLHNRLVTVRKMLEALIEE